MRWRSSMTGTTLAVAAVSICLSCHSTSPSGVGAKDRGNRTVGVSVLTLGNPFFRVIGDHLEAELTKAGYKTVVVAGEFDVAKQQQQVRDFIVNKYAAIVLCPCNSKGIGPVIQEANRAGIPVFTADIACLAAKRNSCRILPATIWAAASRRLRR